MRRINLFSAELSPGAVDRDGYRWRWAQVAKALGSARIGASLYELPAGERTWPYHFHHGMEEWALVVDGTPTLRAPDGERELRRGDVVCFPSGPEGAHQLRGPGVVLILSTASGSAAVAEYPDSGKVGARPPGLTFRVAEKVDYWEGE